MLETFTNGKFEYKKLSKEEQQARGILGRLVGVIADTKNPTRNGRKYSPQLWENVFNSDIMKEKIQNRICFGELGHPAERTEIDIERAAICLAEQPKKGTDGKIYGVFDILNTPNGKILKALCDYGCNIGISSRGQGDIVTDQYGEEEVDPDTYECECFDAVLLPGVESARLHYVNEDVNRQKNLKRTLMESINNADDSSKKIMQETLDNLNISLTEAKKEDKEDDKKSDKEETTAKKKKEEKQAEGVENDAKDVEPAEETSEDEAPTEDAVDEVPAEEPSDEVVSDVADILADGTEGVDAISSIDIDEVPDDDLAVSEAPEEASEEDTRTDEEIFLDFLANNFPEDKVKEVAEILDIEVLDDEGNVIAEPEEDTAELTVDDIQDIASDAAEKAVEVETGAEDVELNGETEEQVADLVDAEVEDKEESNEEAEEDDKAFDEGLQTVVSNLKEALQQKSDLEKQIIKLQEELAVRDAKVNEMNGECEKYKNAITRLSKVAKSNKSSKVDTSKLEESLKQKDEIIASQNVRISKLMKTRESAVKLTEDLNNKKTDYEAQIKSLNEQLQSNEQSNKDEVAKLNENLTKQTAIKESYKKLANEAVNKYIEIKAGMLGLTSQDVKRKLGASYTLKDVDQVCESLKEYQLNISKLPFDVNRPVKVKVNEAASKQLVKPAKVAEDDEVDDTLMRLANFD